jgi:hypothetical protein
MYGALSGEIRDRSAEAMLKLLNIVWSRLRRDRTRAINAPQHARTRESDSKFIESDD